MSRAFDVVDHTKLIQKLINKTSIPPLYLKFLSNYIQGRRGYTVTGNATSKQRSFHGGVAQGGVLSPQLFNIFMSDMPQPDPSLGIVLVVYADDVTLLVSHEKIRVIEQRAQTYLNEVVQWIKENGLILADKTQVTLFTPDPAEHGTQLNIELEGARLETKKNPVILGLTLDPKLNFSQHTKVTETKAKKSLNLIKAISGTDWGQHKEVLCNTYKQFTRPIIEYASPAWAPTVSKTNIDKLQRIQNQALRLCTGHTRDTNVRHCHEETQVLPLGIHMQMLSSIYRENCRNPDHPLNHALSDADPDRHMKTTSLDTSHVTVVHSCDRETENERDRTLNKKLIHTETVRRHISNTPVHPLLQTTPPKVHQSEQELDRSTRRILAQLRALKSPILESYKCNIGAVEVPDCPLCGQHEHNTAHLFECPELPTDLTPEDLWHRPIMAAQLIQRWQAALALAEEA